MKTGPLQFRRIASRRGASRLPGRALATALLCAAAVLIHGGPLKAASDEGQANVTLTIVPIAMLEFTGGNLLYLQVPPPGSTLPSSGVQFRVTGNATAIVTAEPDAFVDVPGEGIMGAAFLPGNPDPVGYKIELRFPRTGVIGSPIQIAALPGFEEGPTTPPLAADLALTGGEREGVVHMEASQQWTEDEGIALPGLYAGSVTLTLTADY
jgi:hypothetical protein